MVIPWPAMALVASCLVGPLWWPVTAWGQKAPQTGKDPQPAQSQKILTPLDAELEVNKHNGYLVLGPMPLTQYDGSKLTVSQSSGDIVVDLRNKKFTVKDGNAHPTSVDTIRRGGKVYVAAGPNEVVLYVPETKGGTSDVAH
jgi:hypothetical protein